jgi:hypothetical protein
MGDLLDQRDEKQVSGSPKHKLASYFFYAVHVADDAT